MTVTIRPAVQEDFAKILPLAHSFFAASNYGDLVEFSDDTFRRTFEQLLGDSGVCLVAEDSGAIVGAVGAITYPFYFNEGHRTGQELFWWVSEGSRGRDTGARLFHELEKWARSVGCKTFTMVALDSVNPETVGGIYKRAGYRASEHTYIKGL